MGTICHVTALDQYQVYPWPLCLAICNCQLSSAAAFIPSMQSTSGLVFLHLSLSPVTCWVYQLLGLSIVGTSATCLCLLPWRRQPKSQTSTTSLMIGMTYHQVMPGRPRVGKFAMDLEQSKSRAVGLHYVALCFKIWSSVLHLGRDHHKNGGLFQHHELNLRAVWSAFLEKGTLKSRGSKSYAQTQHNTTQHNKHTQKKNEKKRNASNWFKLHRGPFSHAQQVPEREQNKERQCHPESGSVIKATARIKNNNFAGPHFVSYLEIYGNNIDIMDFYKTIGAGFPTRHTPATCRQFVCDRWRSQGSGQPNDLTGNMHKTYKTRLSLFWQLNKIEQDCCIAMLNILVSI